MAAQAPRPLLNEDKYVALVSGLGLGDDVSDPLKLSLLVDYLVGSLASNEEQTRVSKVPYSSKEHDLCRICTCCLPCCFQISKSTGAELWSVCHNKLGLLAPADVNCLFDRRLTQCLNTRCQNLHLLNLVGLCRLCVLWLLEGC